MNGKELLQEESLASIPGGRLSQKGTCQARDLHIKSGSAGADISVAAPLQTRNPATQLVASNAQLIYLPVYLKQQVEASWPPLPSLRKLGERKGWPSPDGSACCGTQAVARPRGWQKSPCIQPNSQLLCSERLPTAALSPHPHSAHLSEACRKLETAQSSLCAYMSNLFGYPQQNSHQLVLGMGRPLTPRHVSVL